MREYVDMGSQCFALLNTNSEDLEVQYEPLWEAFEISGYGSGSIKAFSKAKTAFKVDQAHAQLFVCIVPDEVQGVSLPAFQPLTEQLHV